MLFLLIHSGIILRILVLDDFFCLVVWLPGEDGSQAPIGFVRLDLLLLVALGF